MATGIQDTLFDPIGSPTTLGSFENRRRIRLDHDAWVDLCPGWLTGSADMFDRLLTTVTWRREQRQMYDRIVDVPRLVAHYTERDRLPDPSMAAIRADLSAHYADELPEGFATAGLCHYRDGDDSVAWHGDRIGRGRYTDTLVAIVSLGSPRALLLRPRGGGRSHKFTLGTGDVLVMGGSCQRTWDHCSPKQRGSGPRISIQFRPAGVR